jgi:hypothetical protein
MVSIHRQMRAHVLGGDPKDIRFTGDLGVALLRKEYNLKQDRDQEK